MASLEISRHGLAMTYGKDEAEWRSDGAARRLSEPHLALCVDRPATEVPAIAGKAGWPARSCDRSGGIFQLTEVWVEGAFMIEVMDPAQAARYRMAVTPANWK